MMNMIFVLIFDSQSLNRLYNSNIFKRVITVGNFMDSYVFVAILLSLKLNLITALCSITIFSQAKKMKNIHKFSKHVVIAIG